MTSGSGSNPEPTTQSTQQQTPATTNWPAVITMMLGVAALISAELLPVSLLTQMAQELEISTGVAGQMISTTAITAMLSGLFVPGYFRNVDRRTLILGFTLLMVFSTLLTAGSTSLSVLLISRVGLGIAIGGFWAILASVAMQLAPPKRVAAVFSIIFSGVSLALVAAAPLGSFLGDKVGWRVVFVATAAIGFIVMLMQWFTLPAAKSSNEEKHHGMLQILKRPGIKLAFFAMLLSFTGNQMLYIYMRPYMESLLGFSIAQISLAWVFFGIASFVGATFTGTLAQKLFRQILIGIPLTMAIVAFALLAGPEYHTLAYFLIACWGFFGAVLPIIWSTWIAKALPDASDSAGGLYSAALQVAAIIGAALSGALIDVSGVPANLEFTGTMMVITTLLTWLSLQKRQQG